MAIEQPLPQPLAGLRAFAVDLDGVMWEGNRLLPGAAEFLDWCAETGRPVAFVTNTVSLSRQDLVDKFRRLGIQRVELSQIFSAGRAAALYMAATRPGGRVFVLGQAGTRVEVEAAGLQIVEDSADFVLIGVDRAVEFDRLKLACRQALRGAALVAANEDRWFPEEDGPVPGAGCFKAFVEWCANRPAHLCGKPNPEIFLQALAWLNLPAHQVAMLGDMPEVDLVGARQAGMRCILLGNHPVAPGEQAHAQPAPDSLDATDSPDATFANLAHLLQTLGAMPPE